MEPKKNPKISLENKKGIFFQIGLIISLLVVFIAFEWKSYDKVDAAIHCSYPRSAKWGTKFEELTINDLKYNLTSQ